MPYVKERRVGWPKRQKPQRRQVISRESSVKHPRGYETVNRYGVLLVKNERREVTATRIVDFVRVSPFTLPDNLELQARFPTREEAITYARRLELVYFADPETLKNLSA